ncbi:hypothetical protein HD806DRAFT_549318 [Xylariaceae sp. AK1471]|nr:hypothetical protein HD806DRAFT_549318 [Xylariaceae sp. AK1471]
MEAISEQETACRLLLTSFVEKVKGYNAEYGAVATKDSQRGIHASAILTPIPQDLETMRQALKTETDNINILLQMLQMSLLTEALKQKKVRRTKKKAEPAENPGLISSFTPALRSNPLRQRRVLAHTAISNSKKARQHLSDFQANSLTTESLIKAPTTPLCKVSGTWHQSFHLDRIPAQVASNDSILAHRKEQRSFHSGRHESMLLEELDANTPAGFPSLDMANISNQGTMSKTNRISPFAIKTQAVFKKPPRDLLQPRALIKGLAEYMRLLVQGLQEAFKIVKDNSLNSCTVARDGSSLNDDIGGFLVLLQNYIQALRPYIIYAFLYLKFFISKMMLFLNSVTLRGPLQLNIIFEDVLGRRHLLPFQYFRSWNTFQSMLEDNFKDCPGEEQVLLGDYRLTNVKRYDSILSKVNWESTVEPGTEVVMSILMEFVRRISGRCERVNCQGVPEHKGLGKTVWYVKCGTTSMPRVKSKGRQQHLQA